MPTRREFLAASAALVLPAHRLLANTGVGAQGARGNLALFEPTEGCYIGAFIERDTHVTGNILAFEDYTKKKHASYFTYVGYGRPFPYNWVRKVGSNGAAPHIAFEPNNGLDEVRDSDYLRAWARDAARSKVPIFLRWASEMNGAWVRNRYGGTPQQYIEKFRLVSRIMREEAPNVAMLWTPFPKPAKNIPDYYPGDDWVDWVGVNVYSVYVHNGDPTQNSADEDPVTNLRVIYDLYADRKPIHVSEYAATIWCKGTSQETVDWAIGKATRFYSAIRDEFPRVKSVNWFSMDAVKAGLANNNYSLLGDQRMLSAYRELVADRHFLSRVYFNPNEWNRPVKPGTTVGRGGIVMRGEGKDDLLEASYAIAGTITEPFLRGLKNGDIVSSDLELWVQLPLDMEARGIIWQVDGRTIAIKNTQPYRVTVPRERLVEGEHTANVLVWPRDTQKYGREARSSLVRFTIE